MRSFALWLALSLLSVPSAEAQQMTDEQLIRSARAEFNTAIARHDLPAIATFLEAEFHASVSSGAFVGSWREMLDVFGARFAEFADSRYVRTPDAVEVSRSGATASESGQWVGTWTTPKGPFRTGGRYAAHWRKTDGRWRVHAELYVPLYCDGPGCP